MREAIRNKLTEQLAASIGDRCLDPNAATKETSKPYLVLEQQPEETGTAWAGYRRLFTVWPALDRTNFDELDAFCAQVIDALHGELLTTLAGAKFTPLFMGETGEDTVVEPFNVITRGLNFAVLAVEAIGEPAETFEDDPWVTAIAAFTDTLLNPVAPGAWQINKSRWPQDYKKPAVLIRVDGLPITEPMGPGMYRVRKTLVCHALGTTNNEQTQAIGTIYNGLMNAVKVLFSQADNRWLTVESAEANYGADAFRQGQLQVILSRYTARPTAAETLIGTVGITGAIT